MVIYLVKSIQNHPHFENKYKNNPDPYTRSLAFEKILNEIMVHSAVILWNCINFIKKMMHLKVHLAKLWKT